MQKYRLTKINKVNDPLVESASSVDEYRSNLFTKEYSPNIEYWVEGYILANPKIGECFRLDRHNRNGIEVRGLMTTTKIQEISEMDSYTELKTLNSIYKLEKI
jgi:hypothetical protein